jgi:probable addiction module antidote protein
MRTGKTTKPASPSRPFNAAEHLRSEAEVAAYIEAMLENGDARAVPVALRTVADGVGGMTALADKTGAFSRNALSDTFRARKSSARYARCDPGGFRIAPGRTAGTQVSCTPKRTAGRLIVKSLSPRGEHQLHLVAVQLRFIISFVTYGSQRVTNP